MLLKMWVLRPDAKFSYAIWETPRNTHEERQEEKEEEEKENGDS